MIYALRPLPGNLALATTEGEGDVLRIPGESRCALPDALFWSRLEASGVADYMRAQWPERWARVEANGVGVLRSNKSIIMAHGLELADLVKPNTEISEAEIG